MKKPLLAAFAAITLAAAPARAITFIKDVMLIGGTKSETTALKTSLVADGWTFIDYDLNKGASGDYIYLLYKGEEGADGLNRGYITGFYIKSGASDVNSELTYGGRTYHLTPYDGGSHFKSQKGDLNSNAGGDSIHLYYTKDFHADNRAVTGVIFNDTKSGALGANGAASPGYDLNDGCGSGTDYIYMHVTTVISSGYALWAWQNDIDGAWSETDTLGVANVFRYAFDKPTGAFENPPLLDIAIEGGNAVVITPPVANTEGFAVTVVESGDVAGATVTRRRSPDAAGRVAFPMGGAASRFYRLSAIPESELGGVQLWEGGPYWAECNVGASTPEEYGYYFWWGDTVGYTRSGGTWTDDYYWSGVTWVSSTGERMSSSPFSSSSCPTYGKDNSALLSEGWLDSTGNLVAAHDAATAHLGAPWRMPTSDEMGALVNNCTTTWITTNGVYGRLVTGKNEYANRSIFLPAAGFGNDSRLVYTGSNGYYWSSTPYSGDLGRARYLDFYSGGFDWNYMGTRYIGRSVRPLRPPPGSAD